jgi:hypothetical protein
MHLRTLARQAEHAWIQILAGADLATEEVLTQQLQLLKVELGGPSPTSLEPLSVERLAVCWLQGCEADLWAAQHEAQYDAWRQQQQDRVQAWLLLAVKAFKSVSSSDPARRSRSTSSSRSIDIIGFNQSCIGFNQS